MARAPSVCTDIFHGFFSVPLDECQDSVLTVLEFQVFLVYESHENTDLYCLLVSVIL
jgi:hypothetical protein